LSMDRKIKKNNEDVIPYFSCFLVPQILYEDFFTFIGIGFSLKSNVNNRRTNLY